MYIDVMSYLLFWYKFPRPREAKPYETNMTLSHFVYIRKLAAS